MCGAYELRKSMPLAERFHAEDLVGDFMHEARMAPTLSAPVLINERAEHGAAPDESHRKLVPMDWGFRPSWQAQQKSKLLINARCETVESRSTFREAFVERRCVVPASAFYEWQKEGTRKVRFRFHPADDDVMALAGIWTPDPLTSTNTFGTSADHALDSDVADAYRKVPGRAAKPYGSFVILTTTPNELLRPIHDRMPVVLCGDEAIAAWLGGKPDVALELMRPCADDELVAERDDAGEPKQPAEEPAPMLF